MSKTPLLDIKTMYQASLVLVILVSIAITVSNGWHLAAAFSKVASQSSLRIREQQLQQAITLTSPKSSEN